MTMRPIDADALKARLRGCMILMPNGEKCTAERAIDTQGTIESEVLLIPKEVSATDIDKLTEMIKDSLLQAYPNDAMFTAVRHGHWIQQESPDGRHSALDWKTVRLSRPRKDTPQYFAVCLLRKKSTKLSRNAPGVGLWAVSTSVTVISRLV